LRIEEIAAGGLGVEAAGKGGRDALRVSGGGVLFAATGITLDRIRSI